MTAQYSTGAGDLGGVAMNPGIGPAAVMEKLKQSFPEAATTLDRISRMHSLVDSLAMAPFFEPKSLFLLGRKPQLLTLDADVLATWVQHVSLGTRVRLRSNEAGFLSELSSGRFLTAMTIARAHMEVAALAAFAERALLKASETGNWDDLKPIVHQMLFGTSFRFEKGLTELQEELPLVSTEPVRPKLLLEAMDEFLNPEGGRASLSRQAYALLCEYAHPNTGGAKAFDSVDEEEDGSGWHHHYQREEKVLPRDVAVAAGILLTSMKVGYANALLLVTGEIEEAEGGIRFRRPSGDLGDAIWHGILQV
jgi:hypothetical protein